MTVKELKQIIQNATYLDKDQKKELLGLFQVMTLDQANKLAKIILWAEVQKNNLKFEKDLLLTGIAEIFSQMNTVALKQATKNVRIYSEKEQSIKDKNIIDKLIKNLNNE